MSLTCCGIMGADDGNRTRMTSPSVWHECGTRRDVRGCLAAPRDGMLVAWACSANVYLLARFPAHATLSRRALWGDRVDKEIADSVEAQFRSVFPAGAFTQVNVLGYGDDPDVGPGGPRLGLSSAGPAIRLGPSRTTRRSFGRSRRSTAGRSHGCTATPSFRADT
jgi:hypothetical protein